MNTAELFKKQVDDGATEMFFYGLERAEPFTISVMRHKGTLESFSANLEFVRMLSESIPLFREVEQ